MAAAFRDSINLSYIPSKSDDAGIDISTLKANILYQHQQSSSNHDHVSQEIVAILGGIDNILTHYLTSNDIKLNRDQLSQLQDTLNSNTLIVSDPKSKFENNTQLTYTYNINDTYHHYFFGDKSASNIIHYTFHKLQLQ